MLARRHRFHGHGSLRYVYRRGVTVRSSNCILKFSPNPRRDTYRAAVVVSKKLSKSAAVRNRIRRRVYEQVRAQVPLRQRCDLVFMVTDAQLAIIPSDELTTQISSLVRQALTRMQRANVGETPRPKRVVPPAS